MFAMIRQRMAWMDDKGIEQWNVAGYDEIYPLSYYEAAQARGEAFALADADTGELVSAAVLLEEDERWEDCAPALYVHNFVSRVGERNAGALFLAHAEAYAAQRGKRFLRLDSAENNASLARYYDALGFETAGFCTDGPYRGILRQKALTQRA